MSRSLPCARRTDASSYRCIGRCVSSASTASARRLSTLRFGIIIRLRIYACEYRPRKWHPLPLLAQALDNATGYLLAAGVCRGFARRLVTSPRLRAVSHGWAWPTSHEPARPEPRDRRPGLVPRGLRGGRDGMGGA